MVFAAVDGGVNLVRKREQVAKVVHRVVTRLMQVRRAGGTTTGTLGLHLLDLVDGPHAAGLSSTLDSVSVLMCLLAG